MSALGQLNALKAAARKRFGDHPDRNATQIPGRGTVEPAVDRDTAQNVVRLVRAAVLTAVGRQQYEAIHAELLHKTLTQVLKDLGGNSTANSRVRAVAHIFEAELASDTIKIGLFNPFSETIVHNGDTILDGPSTSSLWQGLKQAIIEAESLSASVTLDEKLQAALEGGLQGFEDATRKATEILVGAADVAGETAGKGIEGVLKGLFAGITSGGHGLLIAAAGVAAYIYFRK